MFERLVFISSAFVLLLQQVSCTTFFFVGYADLAQGLVNAVAAASTATNPGSSPAALAATQAVMPTNAALPPATVRKANRVLPQDVDWASAGMRISPQGEICMGALSYVLLEYVQYVPQTFAVWYESIIVPYDS